MSNIHEQAKQVLSILPGTDCGGYGGCGFDTCDACAEAIAETGKITLCPACDNDAIKTIAEILGVDPVEVEKKTAFIRCAGEAAGKKRLMGYESCQVAKKSGFLNSECQWGCIGLGSCIERCKYDAMSLVDGKVVIDKEKCNGCEACVSSCPQMIIEMIPADATNFIPCSSKDDEKSVFNKCGYGCIGCADCALACPEGAIEMIKGSKIDGRYAHIDYDKCVGCVACTVSCRKKIIVDELHDLTKVKESVAFVKCKGGFTGNNKLKAMGISDCKDVAGIDLPSNGICNEGCTGFGNCTKVCRYDAISAEYGIAVVDEEKCVGCGDCIRECPRDMIIMVPYKGVKQMACSSKASTETRLAVCPVGCISCGDCAENCPNGAIEMIDGTPVVDSEICVNCGVCTYVCSRYLISERNVPEYNYLQREAMKLDKSDERKW